MVSKNIMKNIHILSVWHVGFFYEGGWPFVDLVGFPLNLSNLTEIRQNVGFDHPGNG